ncbi:hypothetical protein GCM10010232_67690 [Streptomyces amakusaensis]
MLPKITGAKRALVAVVTATAVGVSGVTASNAFAAAPAQGSAVTSVTSERRAPVGTAQDGRDLASGIFFLQGEMGRKFAELPTYTRAKAVYQKNSTPEALQAVAGALDSIAAKNPGFFGDFSVEIRSGDPRRVEAAMNGAVAILTEVTASKESSAQSAVKDMGTGTGFCVVVVLNVLVAVNIGGAVNVSVAVNLQAWKNIVNASVAPASGETDVTKEQQVADITRLAAA